MSYLPQIIFPSCTIVIPPAPGEIYNLPSKMQINLKPTFRKKIHHEAYSSVLKGVPIQKCGRVDNRKETVILSQADIMYAGKVNTAVGAYLHNLPCYKLTKEMYEIQNKNFDVT